MFKERQMSYGFEPKSNYLRWMQKSKFIFFLFVETVENWGVWLSCDSGYREQIPVSIFFSDYACLLSTCVPLKLQHTSHRPKEFPKKQKNKITIKIKYDRAVHCVIF